MSDGFFIVWGSLFRPSGPQLVQLAGPRQVRRVFIRDRNHRNAPNNQPP